MNENKDTGVIDFNPKAMITQGGAGALIALATNTLAPVFGTPPALVALGFSFLFSLTIFSSIELALGKRVAMFPFVLLVVFNSAVGANISLTVAAGGASAAPAAATARWNTDWITFPGAAIAAEESEEDPALAASPAPGATPSPTPGSASRPFFKPWFGSPDDF